MIAPCRRVGLALVSDLWNRAWTAFRNGEHGPDLERQEATLAKAEQIDAEVLPEVLYDLAAIRLANGDTAGARAALDRALDLSPRLAGPAENDPDLEALRGVAP